MEASYLVKVPPDHLVVVCARRSEDRWRQQEEQKVQKVSSKDNIVRFRRNWSPQHTLWKVEVCDFFWLDLKSCKVYESSNKKRNGKLKTFEIVEISQSVNCLPTHSRQNRLSTAGWQMCIWQLSQAWGKLRKLRERVVGHQTSIYYGAPRGGIQPNWTCSISMTSSGYFAAWKGWALAHPIFFVWLPLRTDLPWRTHSIYATSTLHRLFACDFHGMDFSMWPPRIRFSPF